MKVIEVQNLHRIFEDGDQQIHAVDGVDLVINKGEFTAIVGPSGSGKTTLLNMIGGLDSPSSGKIFVAEEEMSKLSTNQLIDFRLNNIGFVFQSYNLIPVLTAEENVEFTMLLQKRSKEERRQRTKDLMQKIGLSDRMKNRPGELSGGQQQRVAVARALAPKPRFVLADEPTANLDSKSTANLLDMMAELNQEEGVTFVFSTHDQRVIDRAKRIITLEDGKVISDEIIQK
ncbi:MAG: putative ABC transport system ATP-binding protein [Arcticibacterium sp.]|jgi:putative ABC transport system ATP-binding protein